MKPKKSSLDLLIAVGGPKSKNSNGVTDASTSAPDQSGDAMAPGGSMMEEMVETPEMEMTEEMTENAIQLPPGFKVPEGSEGGKTFSTTVRGHVMGDMFYPEAIGDMPLKAEGEETMEDEMAESAEVQEEEREAGTEEHPAEAAMAMAYKKKKNDETAAKKAFHS